MEERNNAARKLFAVSVPPDGESGANVGASGAGGAITPRSPVRAALLSELLTQVGRGSAPAFERLYNQISGTVYGVALRVVRDPHLAEDVAQEALVEVWRQAPKYRPDAGSARSWILTIAHRRAVDRVRTEQAHSDRLRNHGAPDATHGDSDGAPDTVIDFLYAEWEAARVRAGLGALTELQREAIELAYYQGYTHREVSEALDIPLGTAKARLRDGLIKLRDVWEVQK